MRWSASLRAARWSAGSSASPRPSVTESAFANHVLFGECLAALPPERTDLSDEIYLVD